MWKQAPYFDHYRNVPLYRFLSELQVYQMFIFHPWWPLLLCEMLYSSHRVFFFFFFSVRLIFLSSVFSLFARKKVVQVTMLIFKSQSENIFHLRSVKNHKCVSFKKPLYLLFYNFSENIICFRCMSALNISGILHGLECGSWFIPFK